MLQKKADNTTPTIQAAILAAYSLNVGNLRDTGHSAEATPPAAMADNQSLKNIRSTVASSADVVDQDA